uniref:PiggyBac transposable element-derived protein domain-containing protein n=1 Tax=Seriola dumerili TaxID=41447 RepID=A0A3B4UR01_SERDU
MTVSDSWLSVSERYSCSYCYKLLSDRWFEADAAKETSFYLSIYLSIRGHIQGRRGRSGGDAGGSGDGVRDRSRSPHHQRWKTEAEPDDGVPQPPRFNPKRTPGVQPPLNMGNPPPGEIFSHFFDAAVFKLLCENTNKNAAKNLEKGTKFIWTEITPDEMKKFIGMLLYMAVLKLPKISDFWRQQTIFHVPFPATVMSRDRFMAILSNLHLSDPEKNEENDKKKGTEDYDHLHRVRPLMELICVNCKAIYHPRQHLAVDERMVGTKARLSIKQYMKAKPTKWGLKFFVLADMNGHTIDFMLYTGKSKWASGKGLSFDVVAGLVNKGYLGSGYKIYMDNFYTTCGTYRVGVPTTQENALTKKSPRGSIRWIRDRDLLFVKWMDVREVSLCSTIHPVYSGDTVERWSKTGDGPQQKISVPRPTSATEYNKYMGGVDTSDQMIGTNTVHRKTRRWPTTVFQHLLDIAVTNSFVIHKTRCASLQENPMTRQRFQEELTAHLLGVDVKNGPQKTPGNKHLTVKYLNLQILSTSTALPTCVCTPVCLLALVFFNPQS